MPNKTINTDFDLIIIGGGLVGASLACALSLSQPESSLRIAIVEAFPFKSDDSEYQPAFDARSVALSYTSKQVFEGIDLWSSINKLGVAAIKKIHISDRGHAGVTRLNAEDENVDALGYVVETRVIGKALFKALEKQKNVTLIAPAKLKNFELGLNSASVIIETGKEKKEKTLTAKLLVAADGGDSIVRRLSGVRIKQRNYEQSAVIANVATDQPHNNRAFERFTDSGPLALLPMAATKKEANRYSLVWTVKSSEQEEMMRWDDETFLLKLKERFGERAGQFINVSKRHVYPLSLMRATEHVRERLAIIGNAAHSLHPVAGQGFNLGLRDVAALSQVIIDAERDGNKDIGQLSTLEIYEAWRRRDHIQTAMATDSLVRIFSNKFLPLAALRNLGLLVVDIVPPLKKVFARHAMGFVGKLPRLGRGLKL
ncbi:MAG: 2-octaprenyl-6-methoxyphenyl hydroxylase [Gammaproteobacteria bacterium]|nr:2-octaprenyl-6-methoxyphenyl hydroxylase [Gammaproteobacteria bacterium]